VDGFLPATRKINSVSESFFRKVFSVFSTAAAYFCPIPSLINEIPAEDLLDGPGMFIAMRVPTFES